MKFDFAIGNPPYQQETSETVTTNGQKSRKNIFHYFQMQADEIVKNGSVMIYPGGRWIHQSGKGMKQFGQDQMNDPTMSKLYYYPDSREVFGNAVELTDGISIVVKNKHKTSQNFKYVYSYRGNTQEITADYPGEDLMPLNPQDVMIAEKINAFVKNNNLQYLHDAILPRSLFDIESDFVEQNKEKVRLYNPGDVIDTGTEIKLFTNDKAGSAGRSTWFIVPRDVIKKNQQYISEWQVVVSSAHAGGQENRDNQMEIVDNMSAFGRARVALRSFETKKEAENFYQYAKTYIVRYAFLMTDEALTSLAKRVPDIENYKDDNGILDFSKDLDEQLFSMMGFSDNEIDYIKTTVQNSGVKKDAKRN